MTAELSLAVLVALLISGRAPPVACMRAGAQLVHHHAERSLGDVQALYVDTLKKSVTGILLETPGYVPVLMAEEKELQLRPFQLEQRTNGQDWPVQVTAHRLWRALDATASPCMWHMSMNGVPHYICHAALEKGFRSTSGRLTTVFR